jgi:hypothetical protein
MKTFHDYESMSTVGQAENLQPVLLEAYSGASIVAWYGTIEDQLQRMLDDQEASRNFENADRIRAFLNTWRDNAITGSINIDELEPLKAASEQQASAKWPMRNYFSSLRNQLRKLIASEEELPRGIDTNQVDPMAGGLGRGAPPMSPDFGPEEEAPGDLNAAEGEPGAKGAGLEQPEDEKDLNKQVAFPPASNH